MANRRSGKLWTPGLLKSRGWTKELMAQLLPRPQYRRFNGRSVPHWHRTMSGPQRPPRPFRPNPGGPCPGAPTCQAAAAAAQAAAALLGRAWQDAPREETWPWVLAGYYHQAIVSHLPAAARGRGLRSNQISGFLNQFLSLGTRCDEAQLPGVLTHFVQAGVLAGGSSRRSPGRVGQSPVSRGSPGRRGTGSPSASPPPSGGRSAGGCCR